MSNVTFFYQFYSPHPLSISLLFLAVKHNYLISDMHSRIPRNLDRILHTLMRRAAFGMNPQRTLGCFAEFGWDSQVIMQHDGFDANGLANTGDMAIDGSGVRLAVKRNLAP